MGADLGAFFQDADADVFAALRCKLFEPDRAGEARRAPADHDNIVFHGFACHGSNYNRPAMNAAKPQDSQPQLLHTELIPIRWGGMEMRISAS